MKMKLRDFLVTILATTTILAYSYGKRVADRYYAAEHERMLATARVAYEDGRKAGSLEEKPAATVTTTLTVPVPLSLRRGESVSLYLEVASESALVSSRWCASLRRRASFRFVCRNSVEQALADLRGGR